MKTLFRPPEFLSVAVVLAAFVCGFPASAWAQDRWQDQVLFNPSASQLEREKHGSVMIYDGLKETRVTQAMDSQFDRIQSMMFVRTVSTDASGEVLGDEETGETVVEDDGC
jgi:hypothetical protein